MMESKSYYSLFDGKYEVINLIEDRLVSLKHSKFKPNNPIVYSNYANVIKYACRWHLKGGIQDLKKMIEYAEMIVDQYEHEEAMDILEEEVTRPREKVTISDLAKAFEKDIEEEEIRKAFESENEASFDKVSAEYYDTLYGYRAERGPF